MVQVEESQDVAVEKAERRPKVNDVWKCPKCDMKVTVHIKLTFPPTCGAGVHSRTGEVDMELI